ncbi:acyl carrier protein [Candidatus Thorarchaeota archaeon]|nr:MAG: acyl carrier protein [Candidatus Thorarchaeota archaeon]
MTDTEDRLLFILSKALLLDKNEIHDDLRRKDFEPWDSMNHLIIVSEIENEFSIFFEDEEVVDIWTVGDLKQLLTKKLAD